MISYFDDFCSGGYSRSYGRRSQVLYVDFDSHCYPPFREVPPYRLLSSYLEMVNHYWRTVDLRHVFVKMRDCHFSDDFDLLSGGSSQRNVCRCCHLLTSTLYWISGSF